MAVLLSLETSGKVCSVAIHKDGGLLSAAEVHINQSHASRLAPLIDDLLKFVQVGFSELSAVAISSGPGSYTGLRIGVSMAKGICYSLEVPLISINTLDLLAFQVSKQISNDPLLCPMIDARRMEVYCKLMDKNLNTITPVESKVINKDSFEHYLNIKPIIFFGDGAAKCSTVIHHPNAVFINGAFPQASALGYMAFERYRNNQFDNIVEFEPFYLKTFMIRKAVHE